MFTIELLRPDHDTENFDCGDERKNAFLSKFALQNTKGGLGRTYVVTEPERPEAICGYYTISSSSVQFKEPAAKHLPRYPLPAVLIGKLATDLAMQNKGIGTILLFDALERAAKVADDIGIFLVQIEAVNEKARSIYEKRGFTSMIDGPMKMFMNLKTVRKLIAQMDR